MKSFRLIEKLDFAVLLGILGAVLLANIAAFGQECDQLRGEVLRLHILANSDSAADQLLKLRVRDRILSETGALFSQTQDEADAKRTATQLLPQIQQVAADELRRYGVALPVSAELCHMYFSTRRYEDFSLPAGMYDAVRVTIGEGAGHNWWCVIYPPMCVPSAIAQQAEETAQAQEILQLNEAPLFRPKLAVVELFEKCAVACGKSPAGA